MSPMILRTRNLQVRIYPKDHGPPHVHVIGPDAEAKFQLHDMQCLHSRGFSERALKRIKTFLADKRRELEEAWNDYQE